MVRRVKKWLEDDLDGLLADETVSFAFDGRAFEIDLSEEHAKAFRAVLKRYAKAGRKSTTRTTFDK